MSSIECRYCHQLGHIVENFLMTPLKSKEGYTRFRLIIVVKLATKPSPPQPINIMSDLESLLKQVIYSNVSSSTAFIHDTKYIILAF